MFWLTSWLTSVKICLLLVIATDAITIVLKFKVVSKGSINCEGVANLSIKKENRRKSEIFRAISFYVLHMFA